MNCWDDAIFDQRVEAGPTDLEVVARLLCVQQWAFRKPCSVGLIHIFDSFLLGGLLFEDPPSDYGRIQTTVCMIVCNTMVRISYGRKSKPQ